MAQDVTSLFGLTKDQTIVLFSLQREIVLKDIELTRTDKDHDIRSQWLTAWENDITKYISAIEGKSDIDDDLLTPLALRKKINAIKEDLNSNKLTTPLYLILLEAVLFTPYYPLADISKDQNKAWSKLKFNRSKLMPKYANIAELLGIKPEYPQKFISGYKSAINGITGFWKKILIGGSIGAVLIAVTMGYAATSVAVLFAPAHLTGAYAISAGLAALGGGAIAAGGFGMAGGMFVLVGGGALLGGVLGTTTGALFTLAPEATLTQAARLEVVLKEIVLGFQKDVQMVQDILLKQQKTIFSLKEALLKERMSNAKNSDKIKNMEKSIAYLEKLIERNRKI